MSFEDLDSEESTPRYRRRRSRRLPASGVGIASLAVGMISMAFVIIGLAMYFSIQAKMTGEERLIQQNFGSYKGSVFLGLAIMQAYVLAPIGGVLGICAFFQRDRSHMVTAAGLLLNILVVALAMLPMFLS